MVPEGISFKMALYSKWKLRLRSCGWAALTAARIPAKTITTTIIFVTVENVGQAASEPVPLRVEVVRVDTGDVIPLANTDLGAICPLVACGPSASFVTKGFGWIPEDDFLDHFAADIDPVKAKVMYAVQQPLHRRSGRPVIENTYARHLRRGKVSHGSSQRRARFRRGHKRRV